MEYQIEKNFDFDWIIILFSYNYKIKIYFRMECFNLVLLEKLFNKFTKNGRIDDIT